MTSGTSTRSVSSTAKLNRRTLLTAIGSGVAVTLAGCTGDGGQSNRSGGPESGGQPSTSVIDSLVQDGAEIVIALVNADAADRLQVIDPDGQLYDEQEIPDTVSRLTVNFSSYSPGEHRFLAVRGDEDATIVDEATQTIQSNLEITEVTTGEQLDRDIVAEQYDGDRYPIYNSAIAFWVKNNGVGAANVESAKLDSEFVRPSQDLERWGPITIQPGKERLLAFDRRNTATPHGERGSLSISLTDGNGPDINNKRFTVTPVGEFPYDEYNVSEGTPETTEGATTREE